ncbi:hypothetical protein [Flavicella sediminum]|uniref:hypothetical protein n=1 Tax=Flavicella sediminum TaxID=2585141 RepID=UPI001122C443|nr:hypothetical protein [Flavicella sediminum]
MKNLKNSFISVFSFSVTFIGLAQSNFDFKELLPEKFDKANIIQEKDYNVWGTNILKGKDGIPKALIIAILPKDSEVSFSLVIPLKYKH